MRACAGAILAGGQSRRMGRDKADLVLDGKCLLDRACDLLQTAGFGPLIRCGNRPGDLPDHYPDAGPLAGLHAALHHLLGAGQPCTAMVLIPVDMPLLDAACLLALVEAGEASQGPACYRRHPLPLFCPVTRELLQLAERLLADPDPRRHALHVFAQEARAIELPEEAAHGRLGNINTPEEWQTLLTGGACV